MALGLALALVVVGTAAALPVLRVAQAGTGRIDARVSAMICLRGIAKSYEMGRDWPIAALRPIDLDIERGEFGVIAGRSGAGKTTLSTSSPDSPARQVAPSR